MSHTKEQRFIQDTYGLVSDCQLQQHRFTRHNEERIYHVSYHELPRLLDEERREGWEYHGLK